MKLAKRVWSYLGQTQPVFIRMLHLIVLALAISQLITSEWVHLDGNGYSGHVLNFDLGTWSHVLPGLVLAAVATIFVMTELVRHGTKYFFPYLWGDLSQLKADLKTLVGRQLPDASPGGLAAIVQGLGMGALALALLSGLTWFVLTQAGSGLAHTAIELHEFLTNLVIAYLIGHGGMGLLHMLVWMRSGTK